MNKEEILLSEYSKLIANPHDVYKQSPSIIKAAHYAMEQYAIEKQIELLDDLRCKWFIDDSDKKDLYQRINTLHQQLQKLKDGK